MSLVSAMFETLSKSAKAALPFLTSAVEGSDESATKIISNLRDAGYAIRTQDARDIIAALRGKTSALQAMRLTPSNQILDPSNYRVAIGETLKNYSYKVLARTTGSQSGRPSNSYITVRSNTALSQEQILAVAQSIAESGQSGEAGSVDELQITDMSRSAALGE